MSKVYGNGSIYHSYGDETPYCPGCSSDNSNVIGQVHIDGSPLDVNKCVCGRIFAGVRGGLSNLVEEIQLANPNSAVTFSNNSVDTSSNNVMVNPYDPNQQQMQSDIQQMKNNTYQLITVIQDLTYRIEQIIEQNHKLNERLVSDPLVGYRKKISEFNLE